MGEGFLFSFKGNKEMTHQQENNASILEAFCQVFDWCNGAKWWQHEHACDRYDYSYTPQEPGEWLPNIQKLDRVAEKTFISANNHFHKQAVNSIRQLQLMLD